VSRSWTLSAEKFEAFGLSHLLMLTLFAVGAYAVVRIGRRQRDTAAAVTFSRAFAIAIPLFTIPLQVLQLLPGDWNRATSLPLHLCDLAWPAAVIALWTHHWRAVALIYYWGITLTTQAMITPAVAEVWPHPRFLAYWGMHFLIVWAACYLTLGLGLAPTWRSYRLAIACTAVWAVAVYVFNVVADTNYGYLNRKPSTASILDVLGPWPWYLLVEVAIIVTVWALMTIPWTRHADRRAVDSRHVVA
jgi:hypothetical integral membrane protein (TIGR02206 family)